MKRTLYLAALTAGIVQAAAEDTPRTIVIASTPAGVCNNMISEGIAKTAPVALRFPVGQVYVAINNSPEGINSLGQNPAIVHQTNIYNNAVQANKTLQELTAVAVQLVETEGPEAERIVALTLFGAKYGRILKKLVQADIPGLKLRPTLPATIEKNPILLGPAHTVCLQAAQLALGGLNLQEQWRIDPKTFAIMFKRYLTATSDETGDVAETPSEHPILALHSDESTVVETSTQPAPKKGWWPWSSK